MSIFQTSRLCAPNKSSQHGQVVEIRSASIPANVEQQAEWTPFLLEVERMVDRAMESGRAESNAVAGTTKTGSN